MAEELRSTVPAVETATRLWQQWVWVRHEDRGFFRVIGVVDPAFFDIFTVPILEGDLSSLQTPHTALISTRTAELLFPEADPIGQTITVDHRYFKGDYLVTGVYEHPPETSSVDFDFLTSTRPVAQLGWWAEWRNFTADHVQTWMKLRLDQDPGHVEEALTSIVQSRHSPDYAKVVSYVLQPLDEIRLYGNREFGLGGGGDIRHIHTLGAIGLFIVVIACINFTNLATALATGRALEIGMRKTAGAHRGQLFGQFIVESLCLAFVGMLLTFLFATLAMPTFNELIERDLSLDLLSPTQLSATILVFIVVGLAAGWYPALHLSGFKPTEVLKGGQKQSGGWIRKSLVVGQFAISIGLVASTLVVYDQQTYTRDKHLGYSSEAVVVLPIFAADRSLNKQYESVKEAFLRHPSVLKATASQALMGRTAFSNQQQVEPEGKHGEDWKMYHVAVDEDFLDTYDMDIVAGRFISRDYPSDATNAWVLNETAVRRLGWTDPKTGSMNGALGRQMRWPLNGREGTVVGVVKDFHYRSLHEEIAPTFLFKWWPKWDRLSLKISMQNFEETKAHLERTWDRYIDGQPFRFYFLDESLRSQYADEKRIAETFGLVATLAIFVACLGLLGLASFAARRRTKEIGVRKVLGASVGSIILLIAREFVLLIVIASAIAAPIAYSTMDSWLERFHYRIDVGFDTLALAAISALVVALITVSYHAVRASSTDPVHALRYE